MMTAMLPHRNMPFDLSLSSAMELTE